MKRLFALLLLAAMLFTLAACGKQTTDASTQTDNAVANALPTETASSIIYSDGSVTSRFLFQEDKWYWQDDETFPLDGQYMDALTDILMDMGDNPPLGVTSDLAAYGLSDTIRYITVSDEEGALTLLLGATAPDGGRYMAVAGDTSGSVYLAPQELLDAMARPVYKMALLPALPELTADNLVSVRLSRGETAYYAHGVDGVWKAGGKDVSSVIDTVLTALNGWQLAYCVDYQPATGVYELCGLHDPLEVSFTYNNSVGTATEYILYVGNTFGQENEHYYITLSGDTTVYAISAAALREVMAIAARADLI